MDSSVVLSLAEPAVFAGLVKAASGIAKEVRFSISSAGVECVAYDPGNIAVLNWRVAAEAFSALEAPAAPVVVELLAKDLDALFKGVGKGDAVVVRVHEEAVDVVIEKGAQRTRRTAPRRDLSTNAKVTRILGAPIRVVVPVEAFAAAVKELEAQGMARCVLAAVDGEFVVTASDDVGRSLAWSVKPSQAPEEVSGSGRGIFAVEYLALAADGGKGFAHAVIAWGRNEKDTDLPIQVVFEAPGVWARYIVAPRVEND